MANGWGSVLGGLVQALPSLAQAGASIYATSRQPKTVLAPATAPSYPSPYLNIVSSQRPDYSQYALPMQTAAAVPAMAGGASIMRAGVTVVRAIAARVAAYVGRRVTARQALALARRVGPEAAAAALGLTAVELAQWLMLSNVTRGRRRRGITARQISNARSTITRMTSFMARVQEACSPAMRSRRSYRRHRAGCGCVVCRRAA